MASDRQEQGNDSLKLEELRMFCSPLELLLILNHWLVKPMSLKLWQRSLVGLQRQRYHSEQKEDQKNKEEEK